MSLEDLLKRVDEATGPSFELDVRIGCWRVNFPVPKSDRVHWGMLCQSVGAAPVTSSLDAALALVEEQMAREWPSYEVHARMVRSGGEWFNFFEITVPSREFQGRSRHASIALLQCLLRALISQKEGVE